MMLNPDSPTPNLTQLLQNSPADLSSGVRISEWIQSKTVSSTFAFDLSQIEPEPKDSVTKYLNWVCLNAKVFNNFGILLNSSQINNFIEGKSTEIYIILKQLHDKMRERMHPKPSIKSTRSAPPYTPNNMKMQSVGKSKSVSARTTGSGSGPIPRTNVSISGDSAITPTKPICSILTNKGVSSVSTSQPQQAQVLQLNQRNVSFQHLSLAISPTISHERIDVEKVRTSTHSKSITEDQEDQTNSNSNDIATSARDCNIGTIKEQQERPTMASNINTKTAHAVPHVDTLSLLSPDLNDVLTAPKTITFNEVTEKIRNPMDAFQQFEDYVVYDGTKLYGEHVHEFLSEKEKLEDKLNDAMASYQSNNVQYLNNIIEQYRTQKLKVCREMSDQQSQEVFLKKLQKDLEILDDSLKKQFEESKNTLHTQLTSIHHKRLREFALKLQVVAHEKQQEARAKQTINEFVTSSPAICLVTASNINNQNINIPEDANDEMDGDDEDLDEEEHEEAMELNDTLKEVSSLLQKCWQNEQNKQNQHRADKQKEIGTLKEILSVYQNLSKLVQLQSHTLSTTILDFESLCNENRTRYQHRGDDQDRLDMDELALQRFSGGRSTGSSPEKMRSPFVASDNPVQYYSAPANAHNTQVQLLTSSDVVCKHYRGHATQQNEEYVALKSGNSGRKKRRKSLSKKSAKNTSKTPAFSFEHINRQTVSSQNRHKKVAGKKKGKKTKSKKSD